MTDAPPRVRGRRRGLVRMTLAERASYLDRRTLLIGGGAAAGLAVAWQLWPRAHVAALTAGPGEVVFGHYLRIGADGRVTVAVPQAELGQGSHSLIAQIAADELGADWRTIAVEPAPLSGAYANTLWLDEDAAQVTPRWLVPAALTRDDGWRQHLIGGGATAMLTGGATLQRMYEQPVRTAAAYARALLCMAAAARWAIDWEDCTTQAGFVIAGRQRLRFGALAAEAAALDPPGYPPLRAPGSGALQGQSMPRLDLPAKIDGSLNFAADVRLDGLLFAAIRHGPLGDSRLLRHDADAARAIDGFVTAVRQPHWLAAVATTSWAAARALDAMAPVFATRGLAADSEAIDAALKAAVGSGEGARMAETGSVADAFAGRPLLSADYVVAPTLAAAIEPRAATAAPDGDRMRVWVATAAPGACRAAIAAALAIRPGAVSLFQMPGGGMIGQAMAHDVAVEAAQIARAIGKPLQLAWTRAEEMLQGAVRAPVRARMRASLSRTATIDGWHAAIAAPAARRQWRARIDGASPHGAEADVGAAVDAAMIDGAWPPYAIPHVAIDHLRVHTGLPAGYQLGGAHGFTHFFTESFVDELARAAGSDPLGYRMALLGRAPALARCLQAATAAGDWQGGVAGSGQGIACASLHGGHVALVASARPGNNGLIVDRLVLAADIGRVMNPTLARQQLESGLMIGLANAVGATTRYVDGLAETRRLADLGLPTLAQTPRIVVTLLSSNADPAGVEEMGLPLVAPAIANALFTITGRRLRRLPLSEKPVP